MLTKRCSKCLANKPVSEFWKGRKRADGTQTYQAYCKECMKFDHRHRYAHQKDEPPGKPLKPTDWGADLDLDAIMRDLSDFYGGATSKDHPVGD